MMQKSLTIIVLVLASACTSIARAAVELPASAPAPVSEQYAQYPQVNYGTSAKAEQIKRGEYLVKMGDCVACHTAPGGQPFAGGLAFDTPFGTIYSPNITPDKQYGIGKWSDAQFF